MNYLSTRGEKNRFNVAQAITMGMAPDGGLFVPESIPVLGTDQWEPLSKLPYADLAALVLKMYMVEFPTSVLRRYTGEAYETGSFDAPTVTPVYRLNARTGILELWHGPTAAFKDLPLQILPRLMVASHQALGGKDRLAVLVSTSGDTGSAALAGFAGVEGTEIVVFYPKGGTSYIQERQMTTVDASNANIAGINGNFDEAQSMVKRIFLDEHLRQELAARHFRLTAANSINWGRIMPQITYFIYSYLELLREGVLQKGEEFNIAIPSGNFGHILSAYYARRMGVPIGKLICASNKNHVLTDFIRTGFYDARRPFVRTISPSMDILVSSNVERLIYHASEENAANVRSWMYNLQDRKAYQLDVETRKYIQNLFWADYASEEETMATIAGTHLHYKYVVDPHTAVALSVLSKYRQATGDQKYALVAATASPYKFCPTVLKALNLKGTTNTNEFDLLTILQRIMGTPVPERLRALPSLPVVHEQVIAPASMRDYVRLVLLKRSVQQ